MKKKDLQYCQTLAAKNGGLCLSTEYVNCRTKCKWQCKEGHSWEAVSDHVQQGHWCPYCTGKAGRDLCWYQKIAESRSGTCLSTEYIKELDSDPTAIFSKIVDFLNVDQKRL